MIVEIKVDGLDNILQNLMSLNIDEKVENRALRKAAKITQEAVIKEAPIDKRNPPDHGSLHKNIKITNYKDGEVTIHTGGAYHAHLVEFGRSGGSTKPKKGKKNSVSWGPTAPNPFFARGFGASHTEAKQAMIDEIQRELKL